MSNTPRGDNQDSDDASLVARIAAGDRSAYADIVDRHIDSALRIARRMAGTRDLAEDAVQEAYIKLWCHAGRFDADRARFTSWFYLIVANTVIDIRRRRRDGPWPEDEEPADPAADVQQCSEAAERARMVDEALQGLPPRQRLAVTLCYFEGYSNADAAEVLRVGVKGLESLLVRARRSLRRALADHRDELL